MKPEGSTKLYVVPCSKEKASEFINHLHRHHLPLEFGTYSIAVCDPSGLVHGVAIVGRTTTQHLHYEGIPNEWIQEVRRVATDGYPNACSCLYAAAWRLVSAIGYRVLVSYTLPEEGGSSLKALGWKMIENVGGNPWAHRSKRGYDIHPVGKKVRWEISVAETKMAPFTQVSWPVYEDIQTSFLETTIQGDGVGARMKRDAFLQTGFTDKNEFFDISETR